MPPAKKATKKRAPPRRSAAKRRPPPRRSAVEAEVAKKRTAKKAAKKRKAPAKKRDGEEGGEAKAPAKRKTVKKAAKKRKAPREAARPRRRPRPRRRRPRSVAAKRRRRSARGCEEAHRQEVVTHLRMHATRGPGLRPGPLVPRYKSSRRSKASAATRLEPAGALYGFGSDSLRRTRLATGAVGRRCPSSSATGCDARGAPSTFGRRTRRRLRGGRSPRLRTAAHPSGGAARPLARRRSAGRGPRRSPSSVSQPARGGRDGAGSASTDRVRARRRDAPCG